MVTLYEKHSKFKRYRKVKNFKDYKGCYYFVCQRLMDLDYRLYYARNLQSLKIGYTGRQIFPFASHTITRKGTTYKIKI